MDYLTLAKKTLAGMDGKPATEPEHKEARPLTQRETENPSPLDLPDVSPWDLPPEWYDAWGERACIMHYDGKLHWERAEALALADILRQMQSAGISLPTT
jgi:hypothetical protein